MVTVALKLLTRVADHASRPEKWPILPSKCFMCITESNLIVNLKIEPCSMVVATSNSLFCAFS